MLFSNTFYIFWPLLIQQIIQSINVHVLSASFIPRTVLYARKLLFLLIYSLISMNTYSWWSTVISATNEGRTRHMIWAFREFRVWGVAIGGINKKINTWLQTSDKYTMYENYDDIGSTLFGKSRRVREGIFDEVIMKLSLNWVEIMQRVVKR